MTSAIAVPPPASPSSGDRSAPRCPDLNERLSERWAMDSMESADVIYAVDGAAGERCGLFYGDPATQSLPIDHLQPWRAPAVLEVFVNALSGDREVLAQAVQDNEGSGFYPVDEEETGSADGRPSRKASNVGRVPGGRTVPPLAIQGPTRLARERSRFLAAAVSDRTMPRTTRIRSVRAGQPSAGRPGPIAIRIATDPSPVHSGPD
jgi:hypothetical protein